MHNRREEIRSDAFCLKKKYKTIGLNIMYYRRALSMTQSELAEKA